MACKIEKIVAPNGKSSELFKELAKTYPMGLALAKYLELSGDVEGNVELFGKDKNGEPSISSDTAPKFKLSEFKTHQEQVDTMDYLAGSIIAELKADRRFADPTTISGFNFSKFKENPTAISRYATPYIKFGHMKCNKLLSAANN